MFDYCGRAMRGPAGSSPSNGALQSREKPFNLHRIKKFQRGARLSYASENAGFAWQDSDFDKPSGSRTLKGASRETAARDPEA